MKPQVISVDFDGVVVEEQWPDIGPLIPHAVLAMRLLHNAEHKIIINTCRVGDLADNAHRFLRINDIPFDSFNANLPERSKAYGGDCRKISADVYLDDRNLGGFPGWKAVLDALQIMQPILEHAEAAKEGDVGN